MSSRSASIVVLAALVIATTVQAGGIYTVTTTANAGTGSLRWAINQVNLPGGEHSTIKFAPALKGKVIKPTTLLPGIARDYVSVLGDIDQDNTPDIQLDGSLLARGSGFSGLRVLSGAHCTVGGLSITRFPAHGLEADYADSLYVFSCHLGVDLAGTAKRNNDVADAGLLGCTNASILGGIGDAQRNIFSGGSATPGAEAWGLWMGDCAGCRVHGNYFGLTRDGLTPLTGGHNGIVLDHSVTGATSNLITGNVFGGVNRGVSLTGVGTWGNELRGNWFGLEGDGQTVVPAVQFGVHLSAGTHENQIGQPGAGNVFGGCQTGVGIFDAQTVQNTIEANWFGTDAGGTQAGGLLCGVKIGDAGQQTIGGATSGAGNIFVPSDPVARTFGVACLKGGSGSTVRWNRFGLLPSGLAASQPTSFAIVIDGVNVDVADNTIVGPTFGVDLRGAGGDGRVLNNRFRRCSDTAVRIQAPAHASLGDLSSQFVGEGRNVFQPTNLWHIRNQSPDPLRAEGNDFGTSLKTAIEAKLWDKLDDGTLGRVDYSPLKGGVIPTAATAARATVTITAATACETAAGAEVSFTLSAAAQVTVEVLNPAGRTVALVAREAICEAGAQRMLWNGRSLAGTSAPAGRYLARITARDLAGGQVAALTLLNLRR